MPGHGGITHCSFNVPNTSNAGPDSPVAHFQYTCPLCGNVVNGSVVAFTHENSSNAVQWLRCTSCQGGAVNNNGVLAPAAMAGEAVEGLPADVEAAYTEARRCAGTSAYTSCELMCRKILMHVAVDKGDKPGKSFAEYLKYLGDNGYTTPSMSPWVDLIRQNGNIATHEIPAADANRARGTLAFTAQLLKLIYEMDHKVQQFMGPLVPQVGL